jgi:hypothetical protein
LTYSSSFLTVNVGSSVSLSPTVTGIVSSYSISPTTLPNGLNFNTNSGIISGTPNLAQSSKEYTITALNSVGSVTFRLSILVEYGFIDNQDGTISQTGTGLKWLKCSLNLSGTNCNIGNIDDYLWQNARNKCSNLIFNNISEWRLPTLQELQTLNKFSSSPTINSIYFPNTKTRAYWTSTQYDGSSKDGAWFIDFTDGSSAFVAFSGNPYGYVRCVTTQ